MNMISKDARGFVDEVVKYVGTDRVGKKITPRLKTLLARVTAAAKQGMVAHVVSVVPLNIAEKAAVTNILARFLGHTMSCSFHIDTELLGGMKIQVADWVIDTSLSTQLSELAERIV